MITFELSLVNPDIYDLELMARIVEAILDQTYKKKFLIGYHKGTSTTCTGDKIKYALKGVCAPQDVHEHILNQFNEILVKAGVRNVVYISGASFDVSPDDKVYSLESVLRPITTNTKLLSEIMPMSEIPAEFKCALTGQIMDSPVTTKQSPTVRYNKSHLKNHLFTKRVDEQLDPATKQKIDPHHDIVADPSLKKRIQDFVREKIKQKASERHEKLQSLLKKYTTDSILSIQKINSVLRFCAASNDLEGVSVLMSTVRPDVNDKDTRPDSLRTALHYAVRANHAEMTRLLIKHGARVDIKDAFGKTPVVYALESGNPEMISAVMGNIDVTKIMTSIANMKM